MKNKNELIELNCDYNIDYAVKIDSRNRKLNLYYYSSGLIPKLTLEEYFRKSDVINIDKLYYIKAYNINDSKEVSDEYRISRLKSSTKIGCCTISNTVLKQLQSRFKKMK